MISSINWYSHVPFVGRELESLLSEESFAARLKQAIGDELNYRLVDWPFEDETEYSSLFPVDALFAWISRDGELDPEWLASEDGSYRDDNDEVISSDVTAKYSGIEQLAAYGLWFLSQMGGFGPLHENDKSIEEHAELNSYGWKREEVLDHRASCVLLAYQALSYALILKNGLPTPEIPPGLKQVDFKELGKTGAKKRHARTNELRLWAIGKYKASDWKSANQAAYKLRDEILVHGKTLGVYLTDQNAQRTIAEWFRKSV